jgi:hypothetical protein
MTRTVVPLGGCLALLALWAVPLVGTLPELRVGVAGHAFDDLGAIGELPHYHNPPLTAARRTG